MADNVPEQPDQKTNGPVAQIPEMKPGKVFTEAELQQMGFKKTDLRPQYLEPVFVRKAIPLGDLARDLGFTIASVQHTIQASEPEDAYHVLIPTGICYIEFTLESDLRKGEYDPKAIVNAVVLQIPLRPFAKETNTANQAMHQRPVLAQ